MPRLKNLKTLNKKWSFLLRKNFLFLCSNMNGKCPESFLYMYKKEPKNFKNESDEKLLWIWPWFVNIDGLTLLVSHEIYGAANTNGSSEFVSPISLWIPGFISSWTESMPLISSAAFSKITCLNSIELP